MTERTAFISPCAKYRYSLSRGDVSGDYLGVAMLNPSKANADIDDPTIVRVGGLARRLGFQGFVVVNLFGWRATDPKAMKRAIDPVGPGNDAAIIEAAKGSAMFVCAWGTHGKYLGRDKIVLALLAQEGVALHALKLTAEGFPSHPLYLPSALKPFPFGV